MSKNQKYNYKCINRINCVYKIFTNQQKPIQIIQNINNHKHHEKTLGKPQYKTKYWLKSIIINTNRSTNTTKCINPQNLIKTTKSIKIIKVIKMH